MNITLTKSLPQVTLLPNSFIDDYMIQADGEYVKIYLLLLRLISCEKFENIDQLADLLDLTQKDIMRALKYWEKQGLLSTQELVPSREETATDEPIPAQDIPVEITVHTPPQKQTLQPSDIQEKMAGAGLRHSIFMAETFLGRPLTITELNSFCYMDTALTFSPELIEYLIEYCVSKNKKSVRYMESVAINWYQQGIDTVEKAKNQSVVYQNNTFAIMKAFGLNNRQPGKSELAYIKRWNEMDFNFPVIEEAISRTLLATHQASFPYANKILESWQEQGVHSLDDVHRLDAQFHSSAGATSTAETTGLGTKDGKQKPSNSFHNFEQRNYDYDQLEEQLLQPGQKPTKPAN